MKLATNQDFEAWYEEFKATMKAYEGQLTFTIKELCQIAYQEGHRQGAKPAKHVQDALDELNNMFPEEQPADMTEAIEEILKRFETTGLEVVTVKEPNILEELEAKRVEKQAELEHQMQEFFSKLNKVCQQAHEPDEEPAEPNKNNLPLFIHALSSELQQMFHDDLTQKGYQQIGDGFMSDCYIKEPEGECNCEQEQGEDIIQQDKLQQFLQMVKEAHVPCGTGVIVIKG